MNLKKLKIIASISIFLLCFLTHFGYDIMPSIITSFFFPVNESIFEHLKMIYTTVVIWSIIEYFIIKKLNLITHNKVFNIWISGILNIFIFLIIYLPIRHIFGEQMILTFIILFISICLTQFISYHTLINKDILNNKISLILVICTFILFAYFTYNPLHTYLFYDTQDSIYGIPKEKDH